MPYAPSEKGARGIIIIIIIIIIIYSDCRSMGRRAVVTNRTVLA
jgi:hypothetical protein